MSPIFPYITDCIGIIEKSKDYVDEYWFENLNLRGPYKKDILDYIKSNYDLYYKDYINIYVNNDMTYWNELGNKLNDYCCKHNIKYKNYFYHDELVKKKKESIN